MTEAEDLELQRLTTGVSRLAELVERQNERIRALREELLERDERIRQLEAELLQARQQEEQQRLEEVLTGAFRPERVPEARQILDEIIQEVDRCIRQLASDKQQAE